MLPDPFVSPSWSVHLFLKRLGSSDPAPGGGSAAALSAAMGCALAQKVGRFVLLRRSTPPSRKPGVKRKLRELEHLTRRLEALIREDALAYAQMVREMRLKQVSAKTRRRVIDAPRAICKHASKAQGLVKRLAPLAGRHLGSDLKAAAALLKAGFEGADTMVKINQKS